MLNIKLRTLIPFVGTVISTFVVANVTLQNVASAAENLETMTLSEWKGSGSTTGETMKVVVPVYPQAEKAHVHNSPSVGVPSTNGLKACLSEYRVSASMNAVSSWYHQNVPDTGFTETGEAKDPTLNQEIVRYSYKGDRNLSLTLTFYQFNHQTLIQYWLTEQHIAPKAPQITLIIGILLFFIVYIQMMRSRTRKVHNQNRWSKF